MSTRDEVKRELRALFEEVAEVDWTRPAWRGLVGALAASEVWQRRELAPRPAAEAFVTALEANHGPEADTFMATRGPAPPIDDEARVSRAIERAWSVARTLTEQHEGAAGQRLLQTMERRGGWLRGRPLDPHARSAVALLTRRGAFLAELDPQSRDGLPALRGALSALVREGTPSRLLRPIDPRASRPTPAAAAVSLMPVDQTWARSFHRAAWTRGGGPWMGVADSVPWSVASTCHAAVDGYAHARVASAVLRSASHLQPRLVGDPFGGVPGVSPPEVGFAARTLTGRVPRFTTVVHAFATALEARLPGSATRTVPLHIPIAPGGPTDASRWRRRPLYGLLSLRKRSGRVEPLESLRARMPRFLAREAAGRGVLTRVLRATLELPAPSPLVRLLVHRRPWTDRWLEPARVLTGGGYVSWMRFPPGEQPSLPTFPSAIPSFSADRGGAGLSIAHYDGGLAIGLTTSGPLADEAEALLDAFVDSLPAQASERLA